MANVITGHISGNYGGPAICDSFYGAGRSATSCVSNVGDCSHTVVVGGTGLNYLSPGPDYVLPDSFISLLGASYTGSFGCTSGEGCRYDPCYDAEIMARNTSLYVNPGECVEINFTISSRAWNVGNFECSSLISLTLQNATGPNLGVLSGGYWYSAADRFKSCCNQATSTQLYSPTGSGSSFSAYLTRRIFNDDMLSYFQDTNSFCCPPIGSCLAGSPSTRPSYCSATSSIVRTYFRECYYSSRTGCPGGTSNAVFIVIAPEVVKFASYFYCADQPCGAKITFSTDVQFANITGNAGAYVDDYIFVDIQGSIGCGGS